MSAFDDVPSDTEPKLTLIPAQPPETGVVLAFPARPAIHNADAENLRRLLAKAATPWPTPGSGFDPIDDGAATARDYLESAEKAKKTTHQPTNQ